MRQLPTSVIEASFDQDAICSSSSISIRVSAGISFPRIVCNIDKNRGNDTDSVDSFGGRILHEMTTDRTFQVELSSLRCRIIDTTAT